MNFILGFQNWSNCSESCSPSKALVFLLARDVSSRILLAVESVGNVILLCLDSCDRVRCEDGKNCLIDQNGLPHCVSCMVNCPNSTDASERVCGGDGQTYASVCHLERQTCIRGRAIRLAYRGPCQGIGNF